MNVENWMQKKCFFCCSHCNLHLHVHPPTFNWNYLLTCLKANEMANVRNGPVSSNLHVYPDTNRQSTKWRPEETWGLGGREFVLVHNMDTGGPRPHWTALTPLSRMSDNNSCPPRTNQPTVRSHVLHTTITEYRQFGGRSSLEHVKNGSGHGSDRSNDCDGCNQ